MIEITKTQIASDQVLKSVNSNNAGASVLFVGTTRQMTKGRETLKLDYECYEEMAIKKMEQLRDRAMVKWPIEKCSIVHRVGTVELGEASIAVAVSTPHRVASFEAANWLVDTLKKEVPIWKREFWADGSEEWVHPDDAVLKTPDENQKG
ncbi:MAG: molybdenum cofactor biosynthesis protein MoaE [Mariniblastus sp.]